MLSRRRLPLLVAFPALYVGASAIRAGDVRPSAWFLIVVAVAVALIGGRVREGADELTARLRLWTAAGLSVTIATAALATRPPWSAFAREVGALFATLAALRAIRAIEGDVGLAPKASEAAAPPGLGSRSIHRGAVSVVVLAWGTAALLDGVSFFRGHVADPSAQTIAAAAGAIALFTLGATALLSAAVRRLELFVLPRALACTGVAASSLALALALAFRTTIPADVAVALASAIASTLIVRLSRVHDALELARRGRLVLTLLLFGGPVVLLAAIAAEGRGTSTVLTVLSAGALLVGAAASGLERLFLPVKGTLLDALADARNAAREREIRAAMAHALVRVREACSLGLGPEAATSPELWLLHPTRVVTVDPAGYLRERAAELPAGLFDVALGEPYATLRTSVLRALEVRRADLRPLLAWLDQRDAIFATVIAESDDPDGLLVFPAGARTEELTLEEIRAAKLLADAFVAITQATSARERHRERERELQTRIDELDDEVARLRHTLDLDAGRSALASARLAHPATVGIYSAASRMAYEALERRLTQDAPTVIVARSGIDPVPYVARAHLSGPRRRAPLVVVDGTSSREHDLERWSHADTSPLALADRGLLFLVDVAALPRDVQLLVARAIVERRAPWERATALDVTVVISATRTLEELVSTDRLAPELAARFDEGEAIVLPGLRDRSEDLRSLVADRLAREGLRVHGRPIGIDSAAFGRLVEHGFDGEDAELVSIVTRLVLRVQGDVVRRADVDALGLVSEEQEPEAPRWPEGARRTATHDE